MLYLVFITERSSSRLQLTIISSCVPTVFENVNQRLGKYSKEE